MIAAASWRLRRLHRWQAQVYEDPALTEDQRLDKLDRVLRHETALHRQIDKSVRQLGRDVPLLFEGRARKEALAEMGQSERSCRSDEDIENEVVSRTRDNLQFPPFPRDFDHTRLDNVHANTDTKADVSAAGNAAAAAPTQKCQNELGEPLEETEPEDTDLETAHPQKNLLGPVAHDGSSDAVTRLFEGCVVEKVETGTQCPWP